MKWTPHPLLDANPDTRPLSDAEVDAWLKQPGGEAMVLNYWDEREKRIQESNTDPLKHGFELPFWPEIREYLAKRDELYALGGNGSGKTELGGRLVVEKLLESRGRKVLCVGQNESASKQLQQPAVYKYLPLALREMCEKGGPRRRDTIKNITWSQKGGFTESTFVMPNRSQCWFKTVEQYERDQTSFEGPEYDFVWIDEPAPIALVNTLSYRVGKRRGKFLFTFTAVHGYDAVCMHILTGARVLKSLPMNYDFRIKAPNPEIKIPELSHTESHMKELPPGHMPFVMQPLKVNQVVVFMWTHWNVFLPTSLENPAVPALFVTCQGRSKATVRTRLFGLAEKVSGSMFPNFSATVHVIPLDRLPPPHEGTDYMASDPATARSYFALWGRVDTFGRIFIFDESPTYEEGPWVTDDGQVGDGQRLYAGRGTQFFKEHFTGREMKHGATPATRKGDPRGFAAAAVAAEGGNTLFELFRDPPNPMYFLPAKVRSTILLDLEKVNDLLSYNPDKPISRDNEPRLYITENCQNLIRAMLNWSPDQGSSSPWKDPIDTLRYLLDEPLYYIDPNIPAISAGRGW